MTTKEILDKIGLYHFSIGGIGDLLLLLSCDLEADPINIIFWAHNHVLINEAIKSGMFLPKRFGKTIVFQGWQSKEDFDLIVSHPNFRGKAHTPDSLDYISEWGQHADKYLKNIDFDTKHLGTRLKAENKICVCLHGSKTETWKRRRATKEEQDAIISKLLATTDKTIVLLGSFEDSKEFPSVETDRLIDKRSCDFGTQYLEVCSASEVLCVDTWFKTLAGFMKIPCTVIRSEYMAPIDQIFPSGVDPSDNIFLAPIWNFSFTTFKEASND